MRFATNQLGAAVKLFANGTYGANMNRLLEIGFQVAGHWHLDAGRPRIAIREYGAERNVLYAFVCDGDVMYVGTSTMTLRERMAGYASPGTAKRTNLRVNQFIKELLVDGAAVEVFVLPDSGLMHYGQFHLNLAAGLEGSIIRTLQPAWNVMFGPKRTAAQESALHISDDEDEDGEPQARDAELAAASAEAAVPIGFFKFILQPTYLSKGFFNGGVESSSLIGADGEILEIFFGEEKEPIRGTINRTCNANGSPRIFGGPELRRRFRTVSAGRGMRVDVFSPTSIRIQSEEDPTSPPV